MITVQLGLFEEEDPPLPSSGANRDYSGWNVSAYKSGSFMVYETGEEIHVNQLSPRLFPHPLSVEAWYRRKRED